MRAVLVFFNESYTDYLVIGPFSSQKAAETEVEICRHLYKASILIEIVPMIHAQRHTPETIGKVPP